MGQIKWNKAIRNGTFKGECRELRRRQGFDPDEKPTHKWLNENGFSGIQNYADREGKTVDEVLLNDLGFQESKYDLKIDHDRTEKLVRDFIEKEDETYQTWGNSTLPSGRSGLKRVAEFSQAARGTDDLVVIGNVERSKAKDIIEEIFDEMEKHLKDGGCNNYGNALRRFINHLIDEGKAETFKTVEENPVTRVLDRKGYEPNRERPSEADVPNREEVREMVQEAGPVLTVAIILLAGAGCRPTHVPKKTKSQINLDPTDPKVYANSDNKSGPAGRALMAGREFLRQYIEEVETEQSNDKTYLMPSKHGDKPYLSFSKLNEMIKSHAKKLDVLKADGDPITGKHLKQFYLNELTEAHRVFRQEDVRKATELIDDESVPVKDKNYITPRKHRDHFREFAKDVFSTAFPKKVITMTEVKRARAQLNGDDNQTVLDEFQNS